MTDDEMRDLFAKVMRARAREGLEKDPYEACDFIAECANVPYTKVVDICVFEGEEA